jgi:hypothetical protein
MKKLILAIIVVTSLSATATKKPLVLTKSQIVYKTDTVYTDIFNRCYVIKSDTINVTKQVQNMKYNKSK